MQRILGKRILRELKTNGFRYGAIGLLIALCIYLLVSLMGAAQTVIVRVDEYAMENHLEDGELRVFVPFSDNQMEELELEGATLEAKFSVDYKSQDDSVVRAFKNRKNINLLALDQGRIATQTGEVALEKRYCQEHNLSIGDTITIGNKDLEIVGIGSVPDYDAPLKSLTDGAVDSKSFGLAFLCDEQYQELLNGGSGMQSEDYTYAYTLSKDFSSDDLKEKIKEFPFSAEEIKDEAFQEYWKETGGKKDVIAEGVEDLEAGAKELEDGLSFLGKYSEDYLYSEELSQIADGAKQLHEGTVELQNETNELMDDYFDVQVENLTEFLPAEENPRIKASADDQEKNRAASIIYGIIVLVLLGYVISVFVIHGIERDSSVIGALYALGVKRKELIRHYLILPVVVTMIAGIVGTFVGFSPIGIQQQMRDCYNYFSVPQLETVYPLYIFLYGILVPPVIAGFVSRLVINRQLSRPALELLRKEQKTGNNYNISLENVGFIGMFRIRQTIRELRSTGAVVFGVFISLLVLFLGLNCYVLCENISIQTKEDTHFEYMYSYKYPDKEVPENGQEAYVVSLTKENLGYQMEVSLTGIHIDNPYFNAQVLKSENRVVISSAVAQKFALKEGDDLVLTDKENQRNYAFIVDSITQYSASLCVFMDIDSMRDLMNVQEDYYNVVYADRKLPISNDKLYAVTSKEDIDNASGVFVRMMMPMVTMLIVVAALVFCVVMYLMMKVMIDRSAYGISLMKTLGYNAKEIRKLYLYGNFYVVALSAVICIPLAKVTTDAIFPAMVANIACSMDLTFPWPMYGGIYLGILLLYLFINYLLMRRLKQISPGEILKSKE